MDLSPRELEQELLRLKNELGQAREKLNYVTKKYLEATKAYKKKYAQFFIKAKLDDNYKTVKEAEIFAQKETAEEEAMYKATEQMVLNERKAVDVLLAQVEITRSLYARAHEEQKQYGRREGF